MASHFVPSINIIRDTDREFDYLVTPNAKRVYQILSDNYLAGNRAFSILGTYGTGKSSFLLAFERHLTQEAGIFEWEFDSKNSFRFHKIIGRYEGLAESILSELGLPHAEEAEKNVLSYLHGSDKNVCQVIVIDEFGKFLEYAGKHNPEKELYFIQQLAEYVSDVANNAILITTLHQSFDAYALNLSQEQRNEWEKVRGRLTEITFNEPVEQLLYIAAARIDQKKTTKANIATAKAILKQAEASSLLSLNVDRKEELASRLFPLDLVSASALAISLQRYGQNERSLFTFLEAEAHLGLKKFQAQADSPPFYSLVEVYDYLAFNFYSILSSHHNPDHFKWNIIKDALDRADSYVKPEFIAAASALIKVIGLLNIVSSKGAKVNPKFLQTYAKKACELEDVEAVVQELEAHKIIRYQRFRDNFILFEGTDFDIDGTFKELSAQIDPVEDVVPALMRYFQFPALPARSYFFQTGTPRYFQFELSNDAIQAGKIENPAVDGQINLIFDGELPLGQEQSSSSILYGKYPDTQRIRSLIQEIQVADHVRKKIVDDRDKVAIREVENIKQDLVQQLNEAILTLIYHNPENIQWVYQGEEVSSITSATQFNKFLSVISLRAYPHTPVFRSELVNRTKLSSAVSTARKKLVEALTLHWQEEDLGFKETTFPAEKSIYLSLLKNNFHIELADGKWGFAEKPLDSTYHALWEASELFLTEAREEQRPVMELIDLWRKEPFRLKEGFIEIWLEVFLFIKRDEYTLYDEHRHLVPYVNKDILDRLHNHPNRYSLKTFDLGGERLNIFNKYRELTQQVAQEKVSHTGFLETVKPFLVFYRGLPTYAQKTKRVSSTTQAFREALLKSKDPSKAFFERFPAALGYSLKDLEQDDAQLELYARRIRESIRELQEALPNLIGRLEADMLQRRGIAADTPFSAYRELLVAPFAHIKSHLMRPEQKVFWTTLNAPMDDAATWISAVCRVVMKKDVDKLTDKEEPYLLDKLGDAFRGLDNLRDFTNFDDIQEEEEVVRLELTTHSKGRDEKVFSNIAKLPLKEIEAAKEGLRQQLQTNKDLNIAALSELLKELLTEANHGED